MTTTIKKRIYIYFSVESYCLELATNNVNDLVMAEWELVAADGVFLRDLLYTDNKHDSIKTIQLCPNQLPAITGETKEFLEEKRVLT